MSGDEKSLPKPPGTPFGGKKRFEGEEGREALMADKIAMAMAEGRLEEFMEKEMPEGEHARALTMMMLGMTGMTPAGSMPQASGRTGASALSGEKEEAPQEEISGIRPPEDVMKAVQAADVKALKGLLEREHGKLNPETGPPKEKLKNDEGVPQGETAEEKAVIDQLLKIVEENNLTLDWVILRALKVYIEEYRKTGRL